MRRELLSTTAFSFSLYGYRYLSACPPVQSRLTFAIWRLCEVAALVGTRARLYRAAIYLHSVGASRRTDIVVSITIAPLPIDLWVERGLNLPRTHYSVCMSARHGQHDDRHQSHSISSHGGEAGPAAFRRGVCHFFSERGYCGRGERCMYHHVRSQRVRAWYDMGQETHSDIMIDLEGTPVVVISASGMVRFRCGIPREWAYFRALSVVLRALNLKVKYSGDVRGEWYISRKSDGIQSRGIALGAEEDTCIPVFEAGDFGHVRASVGQLPRSIEVAKVPNPHSTGATYDPS